ncbi:MAG TPA: hypothetical protein VGE06_09610 [Flavisolibacter sp.]
MATDTTVKLQDKVVAAAKAVAVPLIVGALMWKFGKGNLLKAAGAGVIGVNAVYAVQLVAGV